MEHAEIVGTAIGDPGELLAGWARIDDHDRRYGDAVVRVRTDDDRVVEISVAAAETNPTRTRGDAAELESHPAWKLCAAAAPAPGITATLECAVICGGDRVAAYGAVEDRQLVTKTGGPDGAFRGGAVELPTKLSAHAYTIGDDAPAALVALRAKLERAKQKEREEREEEARRDAERKAKDDAKAAQDIAKKLAVAKARRPEGITDRLDRDFLWIVGLAAFGFAVGMKFMFPFATVTFLALALVALCIPLVGDELLLPPFRGFGNTPAGTGPALIAGVAFFLACAGGVVCAGALIATSKVTFTTVDLEKLAQLQSKMMALHYASLVITGVALALAGFVAFAARTRFRRIAILARGPVLASREDGTWGATDGVVGFKAPGIKVAGDQVAAAVGKHHQWQGSGKTTSHFESALHGSVHLMTVAGVPVRTSGGLWFSTIYWYLKTGTQRADAADVIPGGCQARVVGRATAGELEKGGTDSLLVFASSADRPAAVAIARLRRRLVRARILAVVGGALWLALLVGALAA